jgi:YbbR domain-containing protein
VSVGLRDFFKKNILTHIRTKIVVVFLAIFLWFYVVTEDDYTYTLNIPIQVVNVKAGKVIENDYPKNARVLFWGKGRQLLGLMLENDIEIVLNLKNVNRLLQTKLKKEHIHIPRHGTTVEPLKILSPDSVEIRLVNLIKKKIPILPDVTVFPIAGHTQVGEVALYPDSLWISGPVSQIDNIHSFQTERLELRNVKRRISKTILLKKIELPDDQISIDEVTMVVDVQKLMEKSISRVPVQVHNLPPNIRAMVIPAHLSLTLEGGVQVLGNLSEKNIVAYIDYRRKLKSTETGHPAIIQTPPGVAYRDANPKTFKLVIERIP